jgi:hypothetical protein
MANTGTARHRWLRRAVVVCLAIGAWYGLVLVLYPQISDGVPALPLGVQYWLRSHYFQVSQGREPFAQLKKAIAGRDNSYHLVLFADQDGKAETIVAYPEKWRVYKHGLLYRLAFLDFATYRYPSFLLRSDGLFAVNNQTGFSASSAPTTADLDVDHSRYWEHRMSLPDYFAEQARRAAQTYPSTLPEMTAGSRPTDR